jgi:hypothetical protein
MKTCELCETEFDEPKNDFDYECPHCGVHYQYTEGPEFCLGKVVKLDLVKGEVTFKIKMEQFNVKLERIHTCDGHVEKTEGGINLIADDVNDAVERAMNYASDGHGQVGMFGDTGMDDGKYEVNVLSVNDQPVEKKSTGWEMKYNQGETNAS